MTKLSSIAIENGLDDARLSGRAASARQRSGKRDGGADYSPKGENTRDRILKFARTLFLEQGYDALVLRRIADALDMKLSNLQYYYTTKDDLVAAIINSEEQQDYLILRDALDRIDDGEEVVRYVVPKFMEHWRGQTGAVFIAREFFALYKPEIKITKTDNDKVYFDEVERLVQRLNPAIGKAELRNRRRMIISLLDGAGMTTDTGPRKQFMRQLEDLVISIAKSQAAG